MLANFPTFSLTVEYLDFKKLKSLSLIIKYHEITYGVDNKRRKSVFQESGVTKLIRYYFDDYEEEINTLGNTRKIHYLNSGAILINNNGVETLYYGYSDYQGNLISLTNC